METKKKRPTKPRASRHLRNLEKWAWGPPKWAELHRACLDLDSETDRKAFLKDFEASIPCPVCKDHWRAMVKKAPPPVNDRDRLFTWSVQRHNEVNVKRGVRTMSLDEAKARWNTNQSPPG